MREDSDPDRSDLDGLIDSALSTYTHADSGLERRVLARVAAGRAPSSRLPKILCAAALAAAACVLLVLVLMYREPAPVTGTNARKTPATEPAPQAAASPEETARVEPRRMLRTTAPPRQKQPQNRRTAQHTNGTSGTFAALLPRQEVFPAPRPLSPGEQALVNFATQAPEAARDSFLAAQQQADAPIAIADLRIAPIQIPPLETDNK